MSKPRHDLARWGELALEQARGPVLTGLRRKLATWRDPRARLIRRRRRARRGAVAGTATTGVLGGGAYVAYAADDLFLGAGAAELETALDIASFGLGGGALAALLGAVGAGVRYRTLTRTPLPAPPPEPVELPPYGSEAREPMQRLRDAERSLHASLTRLSESGSAAGEMSVGEARAAASKAAVALRSLAGRMVAVEGAVPHAPGDQRDSLHADVRRLRSELDDGVDGYGALVAAAGRAVAASGASEQQHLIQDATDRLSGLAAALQELSGGSAAGMRETPEIDATREPLTRETRDHGDEQPLTRREHPGHTEA